MKYAVDSSTIRGIEKHAIENYGINAIMLMEHAAIAIASRVKERIKSYNSKILCVCGMGNNGGDGIAAARILTCQGYDVKIILVGTIDKASDLLKIQLDIAEKLNIDIIRKFSDEKYNIIIDALFGIGFHTVLEGMGGDTKVSQSMESDIKALQLTYKEAIQYINQSDAYIISADIPSGISADTGAGEGDAVSADETVTFGICKIGLLLYPGAYHTGRIIVSDIGLPKRDVLRVCSQKGYKYYEESDILSYLPKRTAYSNKGSYGKVLVVAGSKASPGAAYLTASAAYHVGAGLVKVLSVEESINLVNIKLPEALTAKYDETDYEEVLTDALDWADTVIVGPGLSKGIMQQKIIDIVINTCKKPLVLDADALNIISEKLDKEGISEYNKRLCHISNILPHGTILTPHLKELSRLLNLNINTIRGNIIDIAHECTYNNTLIYVIKDARTIISSMNSKYINTSGNNGMATGGSGDVLAGIIAGFTAGGLSEEVAASFGVYIHGLAGDASAKEKGVHYLLAGDIIESIANILV